MVFLNYSQFYLHFRQYGCVKFPTVSATRVEAGKRDKQDALPHFCGPSETRAGQYVPSTFSNLILEVDAKIQQGEMLKPTARLTEFGNFYQNFHNNFCACLTDPY